MSELLFLKAYNIIKYIAILIKIKERKHKCPKKVE